MPVQTALFAMQKLRNRDTSTESWHRALNYCDVRVCSSFAIVALVMYMQLLTSAVRNFAEPATSLNLRVCVPAMQCDVV